MYGMIANMKHDRKEMIESQIQIPLADFLASYNKNMPAAFPRASAKLLMKFKETHPTLFKKGDTWSLDQHRKKLMDWIPQNQDAARG